MNNPAFILIILVLSSFTPENEKKVYVTRIAPKYISIPPGITTIKIDVQKSKVLWKGTKMRGLGSHEGNIRLKQGYLLEKDNAIVGGKFTADMHSIDVTDIPKSDPVPYTKLKNHLKSEHFFDAKKYPEGEFVISKIDKISKDDLKIRGTLTLKKITHYIEFTATRKSKVLSAVLLIDRFKWNIAYKGNWVDKTFVDKDIELKIELVIR